MLENLVCFFVDKFHNAKCSSKYIDQKLTWQRQRRFLKTIKIIGLCFLCLYRELQHTLSYHLIAQERREFSDEPEQR
ncbi:hypothetical protein DNE83_13955 [Salmonella enterica]|nr:hypothetical protein [Salmonella enterica]